MFSGLYDIFVSSAWAIFIIAVLITLVFIPAALITYFGALIHRWITRVAATRPRLRKCLDKFTTVSWPGFTITLGAAGLYYRYLHNFQLHDSAALYIGLPLILAIGLSLTPKNKSALGATLKGITIALLLSSAIFQEGYICILLSAPLFYTIGAIIAYPIDRAKKNTNKMTLHSSCAITLLALLSLEGTTNFTTLPRENTISVTKVVDASVASIRQQLAQTPKFDRQKSVFLDIFPYPATITGQGLQVGDQRVLNFVAYKQIWWNRIAGEQIWEVAQNTPDKIKFIAVQDKSYLSHYMQWQTSTVTLKVINSKQTQVTWELTYKRILDPSWYFGPMQRFAVSLTARELIDNVATPYTKS